MASEMVRYRTDQGMDLSITKDDVRKLFVRGKIAVSDAEIELFLAQAQAHHLNPFSNDIYLIKYTTDEPASVVLGKYAYLKMANTHPDYDGLEAGVTVQCADGSLARREGSLVLAGETLIAGWCKVYRKGARVPFFEEVAYKEAVKTRWDSSKRQQVPTKFWADMPATMIRKAALSRALREAFPDRFAGTYAEDEMDPADTIDVEPVSITVDDAASTAPAFDTQAAYAAVGAMAEQLIAATGTDKRTVVNGLCDRVGFGVTATDSADKLDRMLAAAAAWLDELAAQPVVEDAPVEYEIAGEDIPF